PVRFQGVLTAPFGRGKATKAADKEPDARETEMTETHEADGAATGGVRTLLRLEGLALFAAMIALYVLWGGKWWLFAVLFLAPDLSFAAYLAGPRFGALVYN